MQETVAGSLPLKLIKQERFAQLVAHGSTHVDAWYESGYNAKNRTFAYQYANRLVKRPAVQDRVAWLREDVNAAAAVHESGISQEWVVVRLKKVAETTLAQLTDESKTQAATSCIGALRELAEIGGFRIKRSESWSYSERVNSMDDEALLRFVVAKTKELGPDLDGITKALGTGEDGAAVDAVRDEPSPGISPVPEATRVSRSRLN